MDRMSRQSIKNVKILSLIPARGGSKGVPGKNKKVLGDKPLVAWTIEDAVASKTVDRVVVSTEDQEIAGIAKEWGAEVVRRPPVLATDTADLQDAVDYTVGVIRKTGYDPEYLLVMFPTSPFRRDDLIDRALGMAIKDPAVHAINALVPLGHHLEDILRVDGSPYIDPKTAAILDGTTFGFSMNFAVNKLSPESGKRMGIPLIPDESIDIDLPEDWQTAERALERWR